MKIYTKTGDKGETSLFGGGRVKKSNLRIEAYGTVDELNAQLGLVRDHLTDPELTAKLIHIQNKLFTMGSMLATPPVKKKLKSGKDRLQIKVLEEKDNEFLEQEMDRMNETLPDMTHFILPGGHPTVSFCHVARCVCRRAERIVVALKENDDVEDTILVFLNRLSDYLFVLARKLSMDNGATEIPWKG